MNRSISTVSFIILILVLGLAGCAGPTPGGSAAPGTTTAGTAIPATADPSAQASAPASGTAAQKTFTAAELAKYDGKNGKPAYIAVDGVVYDVTNAPKWNNGVHEGYQAGKDYTKEIRQSPHGKSALNDIPIVGKYTG